MGLLTVTGPYSGLGPLLVTTTAYPPVSPTCQGSGSAGPTATVTSAFGDTAVSTPSVWVVGVAVPVSVVSARTRLAASGSLDTAAVGCTARTSAISGSTSPTPTASGVESEPTQVHDTRAAVPPSTARLVVVHDQPSASTRCGTRPTGKSVRATTGPGSTEGPWLVTVTITVASRWPTVNCAAPSSTRTVRPDVAVVLPDTVTVLFPDSGSLAWFTTALSVVADMLVGSICTVTSRGSSAVEATTPFDEREQSIRPFWLASAE